MALGGKLFSETVKVCKLCACSVISPYCLQCSQIEALHMLQGTRCYFIWNFGISWSLQNDILPLCASLNAEMQIQIQKCRFAGWMPLVLCDSHLSSELCFFCCVLWPMLLIAIWEFTWIRQKFVAHVQDTQMCFGNTLARTWPMCLKWVL